MLLMLFLLLPALSTPVNVQFQCITCHRWLAKRFKHGRACIECHHKHHSALQQSNSGPASSSASSSSATPSPDPAVLLDPLRSYMINGAPRVRDDYNYYHQYRNKLFTVLFRDHIETGYITLVAAAKWLHMPPSTLSAICHLPLWASGCIQHRRETGVNGPQQGIDHAACRQEGQADGGSTR
jgi:hypothetical protein